MASSGRRSGPPKPSSLLEVFSRNANVSKWARQSVPWVFNVRARSSRRGSAVRLKSQTMEASSSAHRYTAQSCSGRVAASAGVMCEVARERRHDARIAGGLLVLRQHFEHHHVRPPIGVALRAEPPGVGLISQRPLDVALGLGDERGVLQQIGERHQAVEIVRPALPAFTGASEPSAVGAHVEPEFVEPPGEAARLNLQLSLEPALRPYRSEWQQRERAGLQRQRDCARRAQPPAPDRAWALARGAFAGAPLLARARLRR